MGLFNGGLSSVSAVSNDYPLTSFGRKCYFGGLSSPLTMDPAPAEDIPTVSDIAFDSYGSAVLVSGDSRITYYGSRNMLHMSTWESRSLAVTGEVNTPYFLEFGTDAPNFKMRLSTTTNKNFFFMWVDDKLVFPSYQTLASGARSVTFTFPAGRSRKITFLSAFGQGQITFPADYNAWKINCAKGRRMIAMGDSWGHAGSQGVDGWIYWLGLRLGYSDIHMSASGGTGMLNNAAGGGRMNFQDRFISDVVGAAPDDIFIAGSLNDTSYTDTQVYDAAKNLFYMAAVHLPKARVFCSGVQWVTNEADATRDAMDAALLQASNESPNVEAFISTKGWMIGTSYAGGASSGVSFSNVDLLRSSDGNHLESPLGYAYWAMRMADAYAAAVGV